MSSKKRARVPQLRSSSRSGPAIPALFPSQSIWRLCSPMKRSSFAGASASARSARKTCVRTPCAAASSRASPSSRSRRRATSTRSRPRAASWRANSAPSPAEAPVTSAAPSDMASPSRRRSGGPSLPPRSAELLQRPSRAGEQQLGGPLPWHARADLVVRPDAQLPVAAREEPHELVRVHPAPRRGRQHELAVLERDARDAERARGDLEADHADQVLRLGREQAEAVEQLVPEPLHRLRIGRAGEPLVEDEALLHLGHVLLGQARRDR